MAGHSASKTRVRTPVSGHPRLVCEIPKTSWRARLGHDEAGCRKSCKNGGLARPLLIRRWMSVPHADARMERAQMSTFDNPFDPERELKRWGCTCGRHRSQAEHDAEAERQLKCEAVASEEKRYEGVVAAAVMRAVFPKDAARRAFLKSVGASTALAALAQLFPLKTATEVFAQGGALEKKDLKVGFIPITCATPIIMAHPMGFYSKHGLNVEVIKTAGWAVIRDKTLNKEYDAAHMLSPMPLAITLGAGSNPIPYTMPAVENINGQAITLAIKHKDKRDPKSWKGFKFAVPFDYSMPNSYAALLKSIIDATAFAHKPENRKEIAAAIAPANYLNQPETVVEQVLTGTFADGLGNVKRVPDRIDFDPFPWQSFAIWILTQMKRWGQIKGDVDYKAVAEQVFLATDTAKLMKEVGLPPPPTTSKTFSVMGKLFDPTKPEDYIKSFKIKRTT